MPSSRPSRPWCHHGIRAGAALLLTLFIAAGTALGPPSGRAAGEPHAARSWQIDACEGDEEISFAPATPHVGQTVLVAATSRRAHVGIWLSTPPL